MASVGRDPTRQAPVFTWRSSTTMLVFFTLIDCLSLLRDLEASESHLLLEISLPRSLSFNATFVVLGLQRQYR